MQLRLDEDPAAAPRQLPMGLRTGSRGLLEYLGQAHALGIDHVMLNIDPGARPLELVLVEVGEDVLDRL